jgi:hypothetical protein
LRNINVKTTTEFYPAFSLELTPNADENAGDNQCALPCNK